MTSNPASPGCCACTFIPFMGARPVTNPPYSRVNEQERQQILERVAASWRTDIQSDMGYCSEYCWAHSEDPHFEVLPHWVSTDRFRIPVLQVSATKGSEVDAPSDNLERYTVIFAHAMGQQLHIPDDGIAAGARTLSFALDADVVMFEWPGFGHTSRIDPDGNSTLLKSFCCGCSCNCVQHKEGSCFASEDACREAFAATLEFATTPQSEGGLGVPMNRIVLWGSSLGSTLAVDLAASMGKAAEQPAAVVLAGAINSATSSLCTSGASSMMCCADQLRSSAKAAMINPSVPVFVMSGSEDRVTPLQPAIDLVDIMLEGAHEHLVPLRARCDAVATVIQRCTVCCHPSCCNTPVV